MPARPSPAAARRQRPAPPGVLLVHPHPVSRIGLRRLLAQQKRFIVVGEAATAAEALEQVRRRHPALVLMDLAVGEGPALELIGALAGPGGPAVVVLADGSQPLLLAQALHAGARGVLPRDVAAAELPVLLAALAGGRARPPAAAATRPLTPRQREIVACIARGYSNRRIAAELGIAVHTVKHHLSRLFDRLGVAGRLELLRLVYGTAAVPTAAPSPARTGPALPYPSPSSRDTPASSA